MQKQNYAAALSPQEEALSHFNLGRSFDEQNKYEEAIACYNQAIDLDPNDARYHFSKGCSNKNLKKFEEAISCYDKAIELDPEKASFHYNKGLSLYCLKKYKDSLVAYEKAIRIEPNVARFYSNKGLSLYFLKKYKDSLAAYDKAIRLDVMNPQYHKNRADCLYEMNDYVNAVQSYLLAIPNDINNNNAIIHYKLSCALSQLNNHDEAMKRINKALEIDHQNLKYKIQKGTILMSIKKYKEALDYFSITTPNNFSWNEKRIDCLCKLKRYDEALQLIIESCDIADESEIKILKNYLKNIQESELLRNNNNITPKNFNFLGFKRTQTQEIFFEPTKKPSNRMSNFDEFKVEYTSLYSQVLEIKNEIFNIDQKLKEIKSEYLNFIDSEIPVNNFKSKNENLHEEIQKLRLLTQNKKFELTNLEKNIESLNSNKNNFISWANQNCRDIKDCVKCRKKPREIIFAPCGHRLICKNCFSFDKTLKCPDCNKVIESSIEKIRDSN